MQEIPCSLLLAHIQDGVFAVRDGHIVYANQRFADLVGRPLAALTTLEIQDVVAPEDLPLVVDRYRRRQAGEAVPEQYELSLLNAAEQRRVRVLMDVGFVGDGPWAGLSVGTLKDITERQHLLRELQDATSNLQGIIDSLPDIYYRADAQGLLQFVSPSAAEHLGYTADEMIGTRLADLYLDPDKRLDVVAAIVQGGGEPVLVESGMRHKCGREVWMSSRVRARFDADGVFRGVEGLARDISERRALDRQLHYLATHDPLTGLLNRQEFTNRLELALARAQRADACVALVFVDLDNFKEINDRHGHLVGDRMLRSVAERLASLARGTDAVGRMGGDEFVMVLEGAALRREEITATLQRFLDSIRQPRRVGEQDIVLGSSLGVALFPDHGNDTDTLLNKADKAMYAAKRDGKHGYRFAE